MTRSFILIELDNVNAWHVAPKVLSGPERHHWWPCVADESRLAEFLHPLRFPMLLFERGVAVLLMSVPMFGLTGFAAVLLGCQWIEISASEALLTYGDQEASHASHVAWFVAACTFRHVHATLCSHGGRTWRGREELGRGVVCLVLQTRERCL